MEPSANVEGESHGCAIRREEIDLTFKQSPWVIASNIAAATVLVALLWDHQSHESLIQWWLAGLLVSFSFGWFIHDYFGKAPECHSSEYWENTLLGHISLLGTLWGAAGVFLFPVGNVPAQMMLLVSIVIMSSAITNIQFTKACLYFILLSLPPLLVVVAYHQARFETIVAAAIAVHIIVLYGFSRFNRNRLKDIIGLRLQLAGMVRDLERQIQVVARVEREKSQFFSMANHDLRQPVAALTLLISELSYRLADSRYKPVIDKIEQELRGMDVLLSSFLDMARFDSGCVRPDISSFDTGIFMQALQRKFNPLATGKGVALDISAERLLIRSDRNLLTSLVGNLISNAIRYTNPGGKVWVRAWRRDDTLIVRVMDTGIGIPKDKKNEIFREFVRLDHRKEQGSGLGLSIVRRLSALLDAQISLRSVVGRGSSFRLILPISLDSRQQP